MATAKKVRSARRGAAIVEFTFALLVLVPLLLGSFVYGFKLIRALEMQQIVRDTGHMYARGVDFRTAGAVSIAQTLASGFNLSSGGTSELILSEIRLVQQSDCDAANPATPGQPCPNLGVPVFVEQVIIGNSSDGTSSFGAPVVQSDQTVSPAQIANSASARANNFSPLLALNPGEIAYVSEMINLTPDLNVPGIPGQPLIYARSIF